MAERAPPGTAGIVCGDLLRDPEFQISWDNLVLPPGTIPARAVGMNVAANRNRLVRGLAGDWLFMTDDDMILRPDTLLRCVYVMECGRFDVVAPLVLMRWPPFLPVAFRGTGAARRRLALDGATGVVEVDEVGTGCILIRRRVFEALADPWFELGQIKSDEMGEDLYFCRKARAAGFRIAVDLDNTAGHFARFGVWADAANRRVLFACGAGHVIAMDAAQLEESPMLPELMGRSRP